MRFTSTEITRVGVFAALHIAAALVLRFGGQAVVPFSLVPFMAFLAAFTLGGKLGAMSLCVYMLLGLMGVPVFSRAPFGGVAYVLQPTFGFIVGFVIAALVAGQFDITKWYGAAMAIFVGVLALYAVGLPYFYAMFRFYLNRPVDLAWAYRVAMAPFVGLDLLKATIAVFLGRRLRRGLHRA